MSKSKASGGRFSFFSPLYLLIALLMGFTASVSFWFTEHLTVAGMGIDFFLSALLRSASAYIILLLFDFLFEAVRPNLLSNYTAPANEPKAEKAPAVTPKPASGLSASTAKIPASSIGLSGTKPPTKELPNVTKVSPPPAKALAKPVFSMGRTFALFFFVSLLFFVPAFLALFPGYTAYDTPMQMEQFFTQGILNATQPVPLTLLFAGCLKLGVTLFHSANAGLLLHTILQLLFTAACLACAGCYFVRWGLKRWFTLLLIILLEALPFVQIFALTTAKDGFFSPIFALWLTLSAELFLSIRKCFPKTVAFVGYGLVSFLMILTRPQGKYLFAAAAGVLFVLFLLKLRKHKPSAETSSASKPPMRLSSSANEPETDSPVKKSCSQKSISAPSGILRIVLLAAAVLLSSSVITGPLYRAAGVYPASPSEMLSVPIQQMTRVVALRGSELSGEELAAYDTYLDRSKIGTNYIPQISDLMKMSPVFNKAAFAEDAKGFFSLWLRLLKKYPTEYADALMYLTDGYFYQGLGYYHSWAGLAAEFAPGPAEYATHAVPLLPAYRKFLLETVGQTFAVNLPVVRRLCVISLPFWILTVVGSLVLRKKRPAAVGILFLLVLYFGTLLLGPVCTIRYVIPLFYAIPVLTAVFIAKPGAGSEETA